MAGLRLCLGKQREGMCHLPAARLAHPACTCVSLAQGPGQG